MDSEIVKRRKDKQAAKAKKVQDLVDSGVSCLDAMRQVGTSSKNYYGWKKANGIGRISRLGMKNSKPTTPTHIKYKPRLKPHLEEVVVAAPPEEHVMVFVGKPSELIQYLSNLRGHR